MKDYATSLDRIIDQNVKKYSIEQAEKKRVSLLKKLKKLNKEKEYVDMRVKELYCEIEAHKHFMRLI